MRLSTVGKWAQWASSPQWANQLNFAFSKRCCEFFFLRSTDQTNDEDCDDNLDIDQNSETGDNNSDKNLF